MMDNLKPDLYLLLDEGHNQNKLKTYIFFLKYMRIDFNMKFSHSNHLTSLHPKINLWDNMDLESLPKSISQIKQNESEKLLKSIHNPHLKKMLSRIFPLERMPDQLTQEERALACLCKSILKDAQFLFIDLPDQYLCSANLQLLKDCLDYEITHRNRIVLLNPNDQEKWSELRVEQVFKNECGKFVLTGQEENLVEVDFTQKDQAKKKVA